MMRKEYPHLLADEAAWLERAKALAEKTYELSEFLTITAEFPQGNGAIGEVTYHDSCHMNRGLGIKDGPRELLERVGYSIVEMAEPERCCGFGGLFTVRMPEVSRAMTAEKLKKAEETGTGVLVTSDPGCMMQMRAALEEDMALRIVHLAEALEEATR
jgi:L-lactate dehydrogenase complex protein LldE